MEMTGLEFILRLVRETALKGIGNSLSHRQIVLLSEMHVVYAHQLAGRFLDKLGHLAWGAERYRDVLVRYLFIYDKPLIIKVIQIHILVIVICRAGDGDGGLYLFLHLLEKFLATRFLHRRADVLRTDELPSSGQSQRIPYQSIGVLANLLVHIPADDSVGGKMYDGFAVSEKVALGARKHREHIVIKIEEMLIQTLYTMQIHLQRITVERRKILFRNEVFVMHYLYVVAINPFRDLGIAGHYQINVSYERHILLDTPEKIWQEAPVPEPFSHYGNFRMFCITLEPHRVQTINVCNHYIHNGEVTNFLL